MRRIYFLLGLLICGLLCSYARADAFKLTSGETLNGEAMLATANDQGLQIKIGDGQYQKVAWGSFSQEDLKRFVKDPKLEAFVQPFIEPDPEAKIKRTEVNIKEPPKLPLPARTSVFAALFSSNLGLFMMFVLYLSNIYAAYEVSIFRAQPAGLVCGLAAVPVLGVLSTITFLSLPTRLQASDHPLEAPAGAGSEAAVAAQVEGDVNPMHADGAQHPAALKLAKSEQDATKKVLPEAVVFPRGQFTFNRRFFETKFAGFFGVVRRDADKDMVLIIRSARGEYTGQRISRIAANDLHLQVQRGAVSEEVLIPFQEIQEIRLKHKDA